MPLQNRKTPSSKALPGKLPAIVDCSTNCLLLTNNFILSRTMYTRPGWINWFFYLLFKFEMLENITPDNILIKADSFFAQGMQISIRIHTRSKVRLELLTQVKVLIIINFLSEIRFTSFWTCFPKHRNSSISAIVASLC